MPKKPKTVSQLVVDQQLSDKERERGNEQYKQHQFDEAIQSYSNAILLDSKNVLNLTNRAQVFYKTQQYRNAINDSETAQKLDPKWWKSYHIKAASLAALKEYDEAKRCCEQGLSALKNVSSNDHHDEPQVVSTRSSSKSEEGIQMISKLKNQIELMKEKGEEKASTSKAKEMEQLKKVMDTYTLPQLFQAIKRNDFDDVLKCITELGYSVNMALNFEFGFGSSSTPLHYCVLKGTPEMLRYLLENGADWKAKTAQPFGFTVLHLCCFFNITDMCQAIFQYIDKCYEKEPEKTSQALKELFLSKNIMTPPPTLSAANRDSVECLEIIFDSILVKKNILSMDTLLSSTVLCGRNILHTAADRGSLSVVKYLARNFKNYLKVDAQDNDGKTAIHCACHGNHTIVQQVQGTNTISKAPCDHSDQHCVHAQIIEILVKDLGANMFLETNEKLTPLALSVYYGHYQCTQTLIDLGSLSKKNQKIHEKLNSLTDMACSGGYDDCLRVLLANNVKPVPESINLAIASGYIQCVKLLLECSDFDINQTAAIQSHRVTPLLTACLSGQAEIVQLLLNHPKQKIDVNRALPKFPLPLHLACMKGHANVVEVLLSNGADPTLLDYKGDSVFVSAASSGDARIIHLLFDHLDKKCKTSEEKQKQRIIGLLLNIKTQLFAATWFDIARNNDHVEILKALQQRCKSYGIDFDLPEKKEKKVQKATETKRSAKTVEKKVKKQPLEKSSSTVKSKIVGVTNDNNREAVSQMWQGLPEETFIQEMRNITATVREKLLKNLSIEAQCKTMVDISTYPSQTIRLLRNDIEEDWIGFLQYQNISEENLSFVALFLSNISNQFDDDKKKKYASSKGLEAALDRMLFRHNRNYLILDSTVGLLQNLFDEDFWTRVMTFQSYSFGSIVNTTLSCLLRQHRQSTLTGCTLLLNFYRAFEKEHEDNIFVTTKLCNVGGLESIMELIKTDLSKTQQFDSTIICNALEIMSIVAWNRPKDVLKSDGIRIALNFLPSPSQDVKGLALNVIYAVIQGLEISDRKSTEDKHQIILTMIAILRSYKNEQCSNCNMAVRILELFLYSKEFKVKLSQNEVEEILTLLAQSLQHFIPESCNLTEYQTILLQHSSILLSTLCNSESLVNLVLQHTTQGLVYFLRMVMASPVQAQANLINAISVFFKYSEMCLEAKIVSSLEYLKFFDFILKEAQGSNPFLIRNCACAVAIISRRMGLLGNDRTVKSDDNEPIFVDINGPQQTPKVITDRCQYCATYGAKSRCGGCRKVCYCSMECQRADWSLHKSSCHK
ncbi:hypothetical protein C9374_010797 [Naegleria lovaniensis]|uniref:MYND-type domain-containing protein n=1 Tax=Naegleria lovaniensis TaxID=51637 RepID=A0AA88GG10_NAELO|nr:uncharacterized protein C9374_010797 [Naegleria lovaniensis]KAG2374513.1 hypothetical protein C9374_010797 [Naegleria lovaniensis]